MSICSRSRCIKFNWKYCKVFMCVWNRASLKLYVLGKDVFVPVFKISLCKILHVISYWIRMFVFINIYLALALFFWNTECSFYVFVFVVQPCFEVTSELLFYLSIFLFASSCVLCYTKWKFVSVKAFKGSRSKATVANVSECPCGCTRKYYRPVGGGNRVNCTVPVVFIEHRFQL